MLQEEIRTHLERKILPFWMGLSWWKWDETQKNRPHYSDDPAKDRGFVIYGKKACDVLRKWSK